MCIRDRGSGADVGSGVGPGRATDDLDAKLEAALECDQGDDPVAVGDTVAVPDGARLKLRMSDGSFISAASGTRLTIAAFAADAQHRDAQLSLAGGLLRAVVAAASGQSRFEVGTATGTAEASSGDFFIAATPEATQIGVLAGTVTLKSRANGHGVAVPAHKGARLDAGKNPMPRTWTQQEFAAVTDRTNLQ